MKHTFRGALAVLTAVSLLAPAAASAEVAAAPEPTPALVGLPSSVAVLGDSISAGTGTTGGGAPGFIAEERPRNSWATGDWSGLDSVYQRVDALDDDHEVVATNLAENGRRAQHTLAQVQASPEDVDYILVQIGGNDLCRDSVEAMTPTDVYREHIDATLAWVAEHRPEARIQLNAVPDIYRLWELRRTNLVAVTFWGLGLVPCQSLVANPTSLAEADMQRRAQVRERGLEYNDALREACAAYLRCRYDDDATWLFSNDPGEFLDADISNQDHFHPSFSGQQKLAAVSWDAGFDVTDASPPQVSVTVADVADGPVDATVAAIDDVAVAGLELRTHGPSGASDWETVLAETASVTFAEVGEHHLEARATDVNGNRSASVLQAVTVREASPTPGSCSAVSFSDVPSSYAHAGTIRTIAEACITAGFQDGTYRPTASLTRGQLATFLANTLDLPAGDLRFSDVPADHAHARGISAMAGVAEGFGDGTFRPDAPVTRGQMATLLRNAGDLADGDRVFPDVPGDYVHAAAISAVAAVGIQGYEDGTFRPTLPVTRGQMATFLVRTLLDDR